MLVGSVDGASVGAEVDGETLGATDGKLDGASDGATDGKLDGTSDGVADGDKVGLADGVVDGALVGVADGALVGDIVGGQTPHKPGQSILTVKFWGLVGNISLRLLTTVLVGSSMPMDQLANWKVLVKLRSNARHVPSMQL
jgi:hypothetical protein